MTILMFFFPQCTVTVTNSKLSHSWKKWIYKIIPYFNVNNHHEFIYSSSSQKQRFVLESTGEIHKALSVIWPWACLNIVCFNMLTITVWSFSFWNSSTMLQLHLDSGRMNGRFCDFAVEEFACASVRHQNISDQQLSQNYWCVKLFQSDLQHVFRSSFIIHLLFFCSFFTQLSALKAEDLAGMLACNRSSNSSGSRPVWKLLLSKASRVLDEALDLLTNTVWISNTPHFTLSCSELETGCFFFVLVDSGPQKSCSVSDFGLYPRNPIGHIQHGQPQ